MSGRVAVKTDVPDREEQGTRAIEGLLVADALPLPRYIFRLLLTVDILLCSASFLVSQLVWGNADILFGELGPVTLWSFLQILAGSLLCFDMYRLRHTGGFFKRLAGPSTVWLLMGIGFLFLSVDEVAQLHERTDKAIHHVLGMQETGLTDHLDDFLVLMYGVVGLTVLWICRKEILIMMQKRSPFIAACAIFFIMVLLDTLTNGGSKELLAPSVEPVLGAFEDTLKVVADSFFVYAFAECLLIAGSVCILHFPSRGST